MRQLTIEYSLRTRSENETSPSTVVTDTIRKIDYETARYSKLLGTLASSDATGLQVAEADVVAVLLRLSGSTASLHAMNSTSMSQSGFCLCPAVIYGTNKRRRSKLARLLAEEAWFKSRKKITSFEHGYTTVTFESIPFLSCGDLGYQEDPQTQDYTGEQATPKRLVLPTEDFSSPYIWAAKVMFDALTAMQQSIARAEGLLNAIEQSDNVTQKAALMDIRIHINKSKTEVTFLLEQFVPIAQRGSCEVMLTEVTFLLEQFVPIAQRGSCEVMLEV
eukprot:s5802_g3.t1